MTSIFLRIIIVAVAAIVFLKARSWLRWRSFNKWAEQHGCGEAKVERNKLPGGIERHLILFRGLKGIDFLEELIRKHFEEVVGSYTYRRFMIANTMILTADPENVQALLATKFHDYDLGAARENAFFDLLGNGIFTAEGEAWSHYRHQLKPQFARDQVSELEGADRHLQILFKALPEENASGWIQEVDLLPLMYRFTMDVSTEFLFGESVNSQLKTLHSQDSGNTKDAQEDLDFSEAMNYALEHTAMRIRFTFLRHISSDKKFKKACKVIKNFAGGFVTRALDPNHKPPPTLPGQKPKYVLLNELVSEMRDPIELRDQLLHVLLAGRDTTSAFISWVILLLARHPAEFKHLREAIISQFGTYTAPTQELTFESLKTCKELKNVMYEILRLYPIVPVNGRRALRDTILPVGGGPDGKQPIAVMKGENVGFASYVMHRRHDIWGPDADEFVPARWEGRKLGWEFIAFSGGPRVCLGQQYALNEAAFVLVKILQRYDCIEPLDHGPILKGLSLTLAPGNGVRVRMHRAAA